LTVMSGNFHIGMGDKVDPAEGTAMPAGRGAADGFTDADERRHDLGGRDADALETTHSESFGKEEFLNALAQEDAADQQTDEDDGGGRIGREHSLEEAHTRFSFGSELGEVMDAQLFFDGGNLVD